MRYPIFAALLLACTTALLGCHGHQRHDASHNAAGVYRHVVVFKFKDTAPDAQIDAIIQDFANLQNEIPEIIAFEHGKNVSPEGLDQGFTHVFLATFEDKAGLDIYLPHPAHKAFVEKLLPLLEQPFVVDYVAK